MSKNLLLVDDFLPDAPAFREEVIRLPFYDIDFHGGTYKRIHVRSTREHEALLSAAIGKPVKQAYSFLRLNYAGEFPHNRVHCDADCGLYAGIVYLNLPEQCRGGTALWKHKELGYDKLPTEHEIRAKGKSPMRESRILEASWNREEDWELEGLAEMTFNRLAVYPSTCFHSRYPFEAFGSTPQDGRLIWVTFFECKS